MLSYASLRVSHDSSAAARAERVAAAAGTDVSAGSDAGASADDFAVSRISLVVRSFLVHHPSRQVRDSSHSLSATNREFYYGCPLPILVRAPSHPRSVIRPMPSP